MVAHRKPTFGRGAVTALAAGTVVVVGATAGHVGAVAAVVVAGIVRTTAPSAALRHTGAAALVIAVGGTVGLVGGPTSALLGAMLLVVAAYGFGRTEVQAVTVGITASAAAGATAVFADSLAVVAPAWGWALLLGPTVGLAASRAGGGNVGAEAGALRSAMAALDEVLRLAERMPAGFDRWSVARAVQDEIREAATGTTAAEATTAHLLVVDDGVLIGVGSPFGRQPLGLVEELPMPATRGRRARVATTQLPAALRHHVTGEEWHIRKVGQAPGGVVLVPAELPRAKQDAVGQVLPAAAVALANVERFEQLQDIALDAARVRVAHDLHDGVAQALTHVRFELDLLSMARPEAAQDIHRIRRVADDALFEVRMTVDELREFAPLPERLERHVGLLRTFSRAAIDLDIAPNLDLDQRTADEVFRLVQEALSNALRHARAEAIGVTAVRDATGLFIRVADDGCGLPQRLDPGVGLEGMRRRADVLGAALDVRARAGRGTVVEIDLPLDAARRRTMTGVTTSCTGG